MKALLVRYDELLRSHGVRFSLVVQPYVKKLVRNEYESLDQLIAFAEQHGIDVIDTSPYLHARLEIPCSRANHTRS